MKKLFVITLFILVSLAVQAQDSNAVKPLNTKIHELGLFTSTTQKSSLSYKLGGQKWYGIANVGTNIRGTEALILGVGTGRRFDFTDKLKFNVEGILLAYFFEFWEEEHMDKGFQLSGSLNYDLSEKFKLSGGLTYSIIQNQSLQPYKYKSLIPSITKQNNSNKDELGHFVGIQLGVFYKF